MEQSYDLSVSRSFCACRLFYVGKCVLAWAFLAALLLSLAAKLYWCVNAEIVEKHVSQLKWHSAYCCS